ncbi:hypothetical protein RDWZM_002159 [Blomia tropicalis]|uniref:Uncharacterized protein n=1 Tax=Blomia tropicalis TaxID=40697 RepID=A0A9Q0RR98_BLOTA|nr:hypothetical protein RDWZM_002159 [Blomia tropicalis]
MPVVLIVTNRTWTSVNATELNDHILNDGIFEGPTYITRDEYGIPPCETNLYKSLQVHLVRDQTYSTSMKVATVLSIDIRTLSFDRFIFYINVSGRFMAHGYRIIAQAGSGVGTSGKARYSADVAVTDYRWMAGASLPRMNYATVSTNGASCSEKFPFDNESSHKK